MVLYCLHKAESGLGPSITLELWRSVLLGGHQQGLAWAGLSRSSSHHAGDRQGRSFLCLNRFWRVPQNVCSNDGFISPPTVCVMLPECSEMLQTSREGVLSKGWLSKGESCLRRLQSFG